jgi:DNA-binding helix-hairpin-helix protein with protein kinase domain
MTKSGERLAAASGEEIQLGTVVAKAGEGTIYDVVGHPEWVAKIFHPTLTDMESKVAKVSAMIDAQPDGAIQDDGFVVLAWPLHAVLREGTTAGFIMPKIDATTAVEIHSMSNPSNRLNPLRGAPQWPKGATWNHLLNVATNLCLAVKVVHRVDAVIGDFQERNILVSNTTRVTLVDCDSMQFTDRDGRQFLCAVGRPEFTAPELATKNLRVDAREKPSDLFALAVHIYLLLMHGNHPFMRGRWVGQGDQPDALKLARTGDWAGGPSSRLMTHPLAPPVSFLPTEIRRLFTRAFTEGASHPDMRPTADEWQRALMRVRVIPCPVRPQQHQIPAGAAFCPWCAIDAERQARKNSQRVQPAYAGAGSGASLWQSRQHGHPATPSQSRGEWTPVFVVLGFIGVILLIVIIAAV